MTTVVYIASLPRSGSTLLSLLLGAHPKMVAIGEVSQFFRTDPIGQERLETIPCSCGAHRRDCVFWGRVHHELKEIHSNVEARYRVVRAVFEDLYGPDTLLVDSSKSPRFLTPWRHRDDVQVKVVFLIRDVRAYTTSHHLHARRRGHTDRRRFASYHFLRWYRLNRRRDRLFEEPDLNCFRVGYEELCLYPERVLPALGAFLGVDFDSPPSRLGTLESHVLRGNRMALQPEKNGRLQYDHRWMFHRGWWLPSLLFPHIMAYSTQSVYSPLTTTLWQQ